MLLIHVLQFFSRTFGGDGGRGQDKLVDKMEGLSKPKTKHRQVHVYQPCSDLAQLIGPVLALTQLSSLALFCQNMVNIVLHYICIVLLAETVCELPNYSLVCTIFSVVKVLQPFYLAILSLLSSKKSLPTTPNTYHSVLIHSVLFTSLCLFFPHALLLMLSTGGLSLAINIPFGVPQALISTDACLYLY